MTINFDDFEVEYISSSCRYDFLIIYDGSAITDSEIGRYCGTTSPGCVTSSAENLLLYFESDVSTEERGYSATFNFQGKFDK